MYSSLQCKVVVDQRRFANGHRMVGREEKDRNDHEIIILMLFIYEQSINVFSPLLANL